MRHHRTRVAMLCRLGVVSLALVLAQVPERRAWAEPVGNPANDLEKGQWLMGLRGGGFIKRAMKGGAKVSVYGGSHFRGYGLTDRVSLFGNIGVVSMNVDDRSFPSGIRSGFGANVLVDLQVKAIIWETARKDWAWDTSAQYIFIGAPHKRRRNQANWNEAQFATTISKSFGRLKPYAGAKVSLLHFEYRLRSQTIEQHSRYKAVSLVGPVAGLDWTFGENRDTVLNIEGTYLDGAEIIISLAKRF